MSAVCRRRHAKRGFTLVELMVALMGGLFISLAVFALAKDSGRFYQSETRIANATVGGLLGFERLRTDIARAGLMSSPNVNRDPAVCGAPNGTWPANLAKLASIQLTQPAPTPILAANGRTPPQILIAGAFGSSDQYAAKVIATGATTVFQLVAGQGALMRLGSGANPDTPTMNGVFPALHALRIVQDGRSYYAQIVSSAGGASPTVSVNAQPSIQLLSGTGIGCGLKVPGDGADTPTINVVNFIQYDIRSLVTNAQTPAAQATYQTMFSKEQGALGESTRTELVRIEQDITGAPIPGTEELVAEYAVDLNVTVTAVTGILGGIDPTLTTITPAMAQYATFTGNTYGTANTPELIRSVRVRLGVRSREADRFADVPNGAGNALFRFNVGGAPGSTFLEPPATLARVRTFQTDVALHNQADVLW